MWSVFCEQTVLIFLFTYECLLFLSSDLWVELPVPYWVTVVKAGFLSLFPISGVNLSLFYIEHEAWCGFVCYSHIEQISFYAYFLQCLHHEIALDFDYSFFCSNWNDHVFLLHSLWWFNTLLSFNNLTFLV